MSNDEHHPRAIDRRAPWFLPNRSGPGWHPSSWQGWAIIGVGVAVIATVVILFRLGML